jgi:hypothetical protein
VIRVAIGRYAVTAARGCPASGEEVVEVAVPHAAEEPEKIN